MKKCPYCAEEIQNEAIVCIHCGRDLAPAVIPQVAIRQTKTAAMSYKNEMGMNKDIRRMENGGWTVRNIERAPQGYAAGKTCCLGALFLPLALLGKKSDRFQVTYQREEIIQKQVVAPKPQSLEAIKIIEKKKIECQYCGYEIADDVPLCPACGGYQEVVVTAPKTFLQVAPVSHTEIAGIRTANFLSIVSGALFVLVSMFLTVTFILYAFSAEAADALRTGGVMAVITPFACVVPVLAIGVGLLFLGAKSGSQQKVDIKTPAIVTE